MTPNLALHPTAPKLRFDRRVSLDVRRRRDRRLGMPAEKMRVVTLFSIDSRSTRAFQALSWRLRSAGFS
jgi:zona occludens toxin (predicted ATPase)